MLNALSNVSVAGSGMWVVLIVLALNFFGVVPDQGAVEMFVNQFIGVIGFTMWVYGQLRRTDLNAWGFLRKKE